MALMADLSRRESAVIWFLGAPAFVGVTVLMLYMLDAADVSLRNPITGLFMIGLGYFWWRGYQDFRRTR